jgi:hypothetical protein
LNGRKERNGRNERERTNEKNKKGGMEMKEETVRQVKERM